MATISEARTEFRATSGRADMTTADIDKWLNKGQMFLDQVTQFQKAPTRIQIEVSAGEFFGRFSVRVRTIESVWAADADAKWRLTKVSSRYIRETWPGPPSGLDRSKPMYYAPDPMTYYNASGDFQYYSGVYSDSFTYNGILFMPPADGTYDVEVLGKFYSPIISDSQSSWWLAVQGDLLGLAAMRMLEASYRNTQGVNDWQNAMEPMLKAVQDDLAEEESVDVSRMEG